MTQTPENQQQYGSILTVLGENAEQNGKLQNKQITFTHIAIGDANDTYVQPDRSQTALLNELARIPVNSVDVLQPTPDSVPMLKVEAILPDNVNDLIIREFAAVASFNDQTYFHAVGNCARIYVPPPVNNGNVLTPVTLEMIFVITSAEPIIEIDPNVVTASREYVNQNANGAVEQSLNKKIWPAEINKYAAIGDTIPAEVSVVRLLQSNEIKVFDLSSTVGGEIQAINFVEMTLTYQGGTEVDLSHFERQGIQKTAKELEIALKHDNRANLGNRIVGNNSLRKGVSGNDNWLVGRATFLRSPLNDWDYISHEDITFDGDGGEAATDFGDNAYNGRHVFYNARFTNAEHGVLKSAGNIGDGYIYCSFDGIDYGYYAEDSETGDAMHAGAMSMQHSHFSSFKKAAIYINDTTDGSGGYSFEDVIAEGGSGFALFLKGDARRLPFNKVVFNGFWIELKLENQPQVEINGQMYQPRCIRVEDYNGVTFENSYLYDMELVNSTVLAKSCRIDGDYLNKILIDIDETSSLLCEDLMIANGGSFSHPNCLVTSIAKCTGTSNTRGYSVRMPDSSHYNNGGAEVSIKFDEVYRFNGTAMQDGVLVDDGILSAKCNELTIPDSETRVTSGIDVANYQGKYVVWSLACKLVSGNLSAGFIESFTLGSIITKEGDWITSRGYQRIPDSATGKTKIYLTASGGDATVRLADYFIKVFDTEVEAIAAVNSKSCFVNPV